MSKHKKENVEMTYNILAEEGACLNPYAIEFVAPQKKDTSGTPLKYMADALVGLSTIRLNPHLKGPFNEFKFDYGFCHDAWAALDPHHEVFQRSQDRVMALRNQLKPIDAKWAQKFESSFGEILEYANKKNGIDLTALFPMIEFIHELEENSQQPLIYNFALKLSRPNLEMLHSLYCLLFNLRTLVGVDYNAYVSDATHEAVKVDPITDYIPKAEYVVNDAMMYWAFKKHAHQYSHGAKTDQHFEANFKVKFEQEFFKYLHNGVWLIEGLPKAFMNQFNQEELSQALFMVQMDWLLASEAGLLFKIREELYGLKEGYQNIFWNDLAQSDSAKQTSLLIECNLTEKDVFPGSSAA